MISSPTQKPPRVSVVIAAFNAAKYLAQAIESVRAQTDANWELIVVDDGSQDETAAIVREFAQRDNRIRCIRQENKGLGSARNVGIRAALGHFIAFLDADDLWLSEKLALQVRTMEEQQADIVFSAGFIFSDDDVTGESNAFDTLCGRLEGDAFFATLFGGNMIPVLSVLVRRESLEGSGFEEGRSYCEDYDLWLRLAHKGAVFYGMPQKLVRYRIHQGALSRHEVEMLQAEIAVLSRWRGEKSIQAKRARRFQGLYRRLIFALMKKGESRRARQYLGALSACGRFDPVTISQRILLQLLPRAYVPIITMLQQLKIRVSTSLRGK